MNFFGGYNIYREPEALKKVAWIPFRLRRAVRKLAAKLPDVKGRDFLIRAGMKVEERFIGNAYIYREKEKAQILKNKVTGPSTQEYLRPFLNNLSQKTEDHFKTWKNAVCRSELLASWRYFAESR